MLSTKGRPEANKLPSLDFNGGTVPPEIASGGQLQSGFTSKEALQHIDEVGVARDVYALIILARKTLFICCGGSPE